IAGSAGGRGKQRNPATRSLTALTTGGPEHRDCRLSRKAPLEERSDGGARTSSRTIGEVYSRPLAADRPARHAATQVYWSTVRPVSGLVTSATWTRATRWPLSRPVGHGSWPVNTLIAPSRASLP